MWWQAHPPTKASRAQTFLFGGGVAASQQLIPVGSFSDKIPAGSFSGNIAKWNVVTEVHQLRQTNASFDIVAHTICRFALLALFCGGHELRGQWDLDVLFGKMPPAPSIPFSQLQIPRSFADSVWGPARSPGWNCPALIRPWSFRWSFLHLRLIFGIFRRYHQSLSWFDQKRCARAGCSVQACLEHFGAPNAPHLRSKGCPGALPLCI